MYMHRALNRHECLQELPKHVWTWAYAMNPKPTLTRKFASEEAALESHAVSSTALSIPCNSS
jgi:hypothetical protein